MCEKIWFCPVRTNNADQPANPCIQISTLFDWFDSLAPIQHYSQSCLHGSSWVEPVPIGRRYLLKDTIQYLRWGLNQQPSIFSQALYHEPQCSLNFLYEKFLYSSMSIKLIFGLVWFFTSQSTAMVMSRLSVHQTTLFPGQAWLSF